MNVLLLFLFCNVFIEICQNQQMDAVSYLTKKYLTDINNLQEKLKESYKDLVEREQIAQNVITSTIRNSKFEGVSKAGKVKQILAEKKRYAGPHHLTKTFLTEQKIKVAKLSNKNNALECLPSQADISMLYRIKTNFLRLEKVVASLVNFCRYLNPLQIEQTSLHTCIISKIKHIHLQIPIIELEFRRQLNFILNFVKKCTMGKSATIDENLNNIILNMHQFGSKMKY